MYYSHLSAEYEVGVTYDSTFCRTVRRYPTIERIVYNFSILGLSLQAFSVLLSSHTTEGINNFLIRRCIVTAGVFLKKATQLCRRSAPLSNYFRVLAIWRVRPAA